MVNMNTTDKEDSIRFTIYTSDQLYELRKAFEAQKLAKTKLSKSNRNRRHRSKLKALSQIVTSLPSIDIITETSPHLIAAPSIIPTLSSKAFIDSITINELFNLKRDNLPTNEGCILVNNAFATKPGTMSTLQKWCRKGEVIHKSTDETSRWMRFILPYLSTHKAVATSVLPNISEVHEYIYIYIYI